MAEQQLSRRSFIPVDMQVSSRPVATPDDPERNARHTDRTPAPEERKPAGAEQDKIASGDHFAVSFTHDGNDGCNGFSVS